MESLGVPGTMSPNDLDVSLSTSSALAVGRHPVEGGIAILTHP